MEKIELHTIKKTYKIWPKTLLLGLLFLNFALLFWYDLVEVEQLVYYYYAPVIFNCVDILFLNDDLNSVSEKFEMINLTLKRQLDEATDLPKIFPLTQIKILESADIDFSMEQIQELSYYHFDLVQDTQSVVKQFEITIIAALVVWFENVIETIYYIVYILVNGTENYLRSYSINISFLIFCFAWLFILIKTLSNVKDEAGKAATYVHEIWNKFARNGKIDSRIYILELVSLRLFNTKLEFTAMGLFDLDWSICRMVKIKNIKTDVYFYLFIFRWWLQLQRML